MNSSPTFAPFAQRIFRDVWLAGIVSNFGALIQAVAAAWMMTAISDESYMVALVQAAATAPIMFFSLFAGAIADNFDRRKVMLYAQALMFGAAVALTATTYLGLITPWLLLGFTFLIGTGTAFYAPSWQASVGDMVPREALPPAVSLNAVGNNVARSAGPAIGGLIVSLAGSAVAFVVNAFCYLPLIYVLWRWRPPASTSTLPRESLGAAVSVGLGYVAMSPNINKVLIRSCIFGFAGAAIVALMPLVMFENLGGGALLYGLLFTSFGVGAIGGGLLSGRIRRLLAPETIIRSTFVMSALGATVIAWSSNIPLTFAAYVICGANWVASVSTFNILVQTSAPRWVVGRAISIFQVSAFGGMAAGSWAFGMVAGAHGADVAMQASGALFLAGALAGFGWLSLPDLPSGNLDPLNRWREPRLDIELSLRNGPVLVVIEYQILDAKIDVFLNVMAECKRIRRRDGARRWHLSRDVGQADVWVETFRLATWGDYLRHVQRITHADAEIGQRLRALHAGPEEPKRRCLLERPTGRYVSQLGYE